MLWQSISCMHISVLQWAQKDNGMQICECHTAQLKTVSAATTSRMVFQSCFLITSCSSHEEIILVFYSKYAIVCHILGSTEDMFTWDILLTSCSKSSLEDFPLIWGVMDLIDASSTLAGLPFCWANKHDSLCAKDPAFTPWWKSWGNSPVECMEGVIFTWKRLITTQIYSHTRDTPAYHKAPWIAASLLKIFKITICNFRTI